MVGTNRSRTSNLSRIKDELVLTCDLPLSLSPLHVRMGYRGTLKNLKIRGDEESKWIFRAGRRIQAVLRRDAICMPGTSNE